MSWCPSRREVVASLLGSSALALLSSQQGCGPRVPVGEIVGANAQLGHALRDMSAPEQFGSPASERHTSVLIVGGGIAGLSAAWRLAGDGRVPFHLLELERDIGGTATWGHRGQWRYPWGAHYVPLPQYPNRALTRLLQEMDVLDIERSRLTGHVIGREEALVAEPEERVFYRGKWRRGLVPHGAVSHRDRAQMAVFKREILRWARWRDAWGRPAFALPIAACSTDAYATQLDRISAARWLRQLGIDSPVVRWYVDYACRDDYGSSIDTTSAWAAVFYFAARIDPVSGETAPFVTWPEGNGHVVEHLRKSIKGRVSSQQLVVDVAPSADGVSVLVLDGITRQMHRWTAQHVILAVPRYVAGRVLRPWRQHPPSWLHQFDTAPWLVANVHLRDYPLSSGVQPAWDNIIYDSPSLGYVRSEHQSHARSRGGVWTYYYALNDPDPNVARRHLLGATQHEWADVILTDLQVAHPDIRRQVVGIDIMRWGHAMVRPRPGFMWSKARIDAWKPVRGRVHFAHTDLSGVALIEEAQHHGVRAAEQTLSSLVSLPMSWL